MKQRSLKVNAILNGIRQVCGILFPLITFPYVSRVLGSDGFGKYNFSQSVTSYFTLIAELGITTYAIREGAIIRDDKEKINVFCSQIFSINIFSAAISLIGLGILLLGSAKIGGYAPYILIESTAIIMAVAGTNWINSIYEDYLYLTIRYIVVQCIALVAMFVFVRLPSDVIPYCIISVLATNGGNLINIFYVKRYVKVHFTFRMDIKKHLRPLLILFVNSIAITIYVNSDITMLGFYESDSIVGVYSFASKIYNILKQLINAVVVVSLPRIAYILSNRKERYEEYINKIFSALNLCMWPIIIGMIFMSDAMILIAGGSQYIAGDSSLKILSIAMLFAIYASLFTNCVLIVNQQEDKCLRATLVSAVVNVGLNLILIPTVGIVGAAITTIIAEVMNCSMKMHYAKPYFDWQKLDFKGSSSTFLATICVAIICLICNCVVQNIFARLITSVVICAIVYPLVLMLLKNQSAIECMQAVKRRLRRG